jgi:hypothetical protein
MPQIVFDADKTPTTVPMAPVNVPVDLKVDSCELGVSSESSKNPGAPQYKVVAKLVAPGELYDGDNMYLYFTDVLKDRKALIKLNQLATACGIDIKSGKWETEQLIGCAFKATLSVKAAGNGYDEGRNLKAYINP